MSDDPARGRFFTIQAVRLAGVAFVVIGMLIVTRRIVLPAWLGAPWIGYVLIANGLIDVLVIPTKLARRWKTPE